MRRWELDHNAHKSEEKETVLTQRAAAHRIPPAPLCSLARGDTGYNQPQAVIRTGICASRMLSMYRSSRCPSLSPIRGVASALPLEGVHAGASAVGTSCESEHVYVRIILHANVVDGFDLLVDAPHVVRYGVWCSQ